jgi:2-dehydropantoate 2-reductase
MSYRQTAAPPVVRDNRRAAALTGRDTMRIAIVGPGAIGGLFAAVLTRGGLDVTLIDKSAERAAFIRRHGLRVEGRGGDYTVRVKAVACPLSPEPFDVVLVAVKAYDTAAAAALVAPVVGPQTAVLTVQNGLGNVEALAAAFGRERVLGGATSQGANVIEPGRIDHAGVAATTIGELDGQLTERVRRIASAWTAAGLETTVSDNIDGALWAKLLVSVAINPLAALLRVRNGVLIEHPETQDLMRLAVTEAAQVARAKGVRLGVPDPVQHAAVAARATAGNIASMLQDVRAGRPTEIDFLTGAVVREGERLGVPTPICRMLTLLVQAASALKKDALPPLPDRTWESRHA